MIIEKNDRNYAEPSITRWKSLILGFSKDCICVFVFGVFRGIWRSNYSVVFGHHHFVLQHLYSPYNEFSLVYTFCTGSYRNACAADNGVGTLQCGAPDLSPIIRDRESILETFKTIKIRECDDWDGKRIAF